MDHELELVSSTVLYCLRPLITDWTVSFQFRQTQAQYFSYCAAAFENPLPRKSLEPQKEHEQEITDPEVSSPRSLHPTNVA